MGQPLRALVQHAAPALGAEFRDARRPLPWSRQGHPGCAPSRLSESEKTESSPMVRPNSRLVTRHGRRPQPSSGDRLQSSSVNSAQAATTLKFTDIDVPSAVATALGALPKILAYREEA